MKKIFIITSFIFVFLLVSCQEEVNFIQNNNIEDSKTFKVDIKGAVMFPGIYEVEENMLLIDLINLAGGLRSDADVRNINLVSIIEPNQMIVIPEKTKDNSNAPLENLININTATKEELMILPGIGEVKAQKIIDYRMKNGSFVSIDELKKVSGISEEVFNKIKELVRV